MLVYISHSWHYVVSDANASTLTALNIGPLAVLGFFCLSGYVIAEATDRFYRGRPQQFLMNRLLRLFPPFWWALGVSVVVHVLCYEAVRDTLAGTGRSAIPPTAFEWQNILTNVTGIVPAVGLQHWLGYETRTYWFVQFTWAVAVELAFYVVVYGVMCGGVLLATRRRPAGTTLTMVTIAALLLVHLLTGQVGTGVGRYTQFIPYFMFGWLLYRSGDGAWRPGPLIGCIVCAGLMLASVVRFVTEGLDVAPEVRTFDRVVLVLLLTVFVLLSFVRVSPSFKRIDRALGDLSYPMYLNQWPVILLIDTYMLPAARGVAVQAAGLLALVSLAAIANRVVDLPVARVRERLRGVAL